MKDLMNKYRMMLRATALAVGLSVGMVTATSAQPPVVIGSGLVNVQIGQVVVATGDILSDNEVQLQVGAALQLAANVCGVAVGVLAQQLGSGVAECESAPNQLGVANFAVID